MRGLPPLERLLAGREEPHGHSQRVRRRFRHDEMRHMYGIERSPEQGLSVRRRQGLVGVVEVARVAVESVTAGGQLRSKPLALG